MRRRLRAEIGRPGGEGRWQRNDGDIAASPPRVDLDCVDLDLLCSPWGNGWFREDGKKGAAPRPAVGERRLLPCSPQEAAHRRHRRVSSTSSCFLALFPFEILLSDVERRREIHRSSSTRVQFTGVSMLWLLLPA